MMRTGLIAAAALTMAGCAPVDDIGAEAEASADATMKDAAGKVFGMASLTQMGTGSILTIKVQNMTPGNHGFHLHTVGRCDGPDFATAGGHWNPAGKKHGRNNPAGPHAGDLPDLIVGADGQGSLNVDLPDVLVMGGTAPVLDADGTALVIHASADDNVTDPSGNSGARIACGVFSNL